MSIIDAVPATLAFLMQRKGLNQTGLSEATGIRKSQISRYLSGASTPQFQQIERLIQGLDVEPYRFFLLVARMQQLQQSLEPRVDGRRLRHPDPFLEILLDRACQAQREAREEAERGEEGEGDPGEAADDGPVGRRPAGLGADDARLLRRLAEAHEQSTRSLQTLSDLLYELVDPRRVS